MEDLTTQNIETDTTNQAARESAARDSLYAIAHALMPPGRPIDPETVEGRMLRACVDGLLTGRNRMGDDDDDETMLRTDVSNPGAIEMMHRECLKLASEGCDDAASADSTADSTAAV